MSESKSDMASPQNREEALFQAAVQLTGAERASFLNGACLGDNALRQRLDALLAAHDEPDELSPKDKPAVVATIKLELADAPDEAVGQTLGRYKLLEKVGEGGCGVVYVAEQTEPVRRRVALKVIKLGMDTKQVVARFEAERQALAMMDHPNIAKVLDAGTTETGRPYFVMELVRGIRITEYCDQNTLSTRERLNLFIQVCHAIQHAHQKGIIHRDIKPSNILVTLHDGVPVPKVIDFGIAKATEGLLTDATIYTQLHQFIGTPAYISPEQAEMSGLDVDTRSDIYSLGVLLYELLAGSTPFDPNELMSQGIDAMRKTIREKEPMRPSTRFATLKGEELTTTAKRRSADKSKLMHQLKGDLDWIVMKCLEKDRTRRYETANGLAHDILCHLNNEPVLARPPSKLYRFEKLARRNKLVFAAGACVATSLAIGLGISTWMFLKKRESRQDADAARARETVFRHKAEARATLAQAKVDYDDGKFDDAERRLNEIPASLLEPDSTHADLRRNLGLLHGVRNQWRDSAANLCVLMQVNGWDQGRNPNTWETVSLDCIACGAALVEAGDTNGYETFRQATVARYLNTTDPIIAGRVCMSSSLVPVGDKLIGQLGRLYDLAERGQNDPAIPATLKDWIFVHLAIVDYRRGEYEKALGWCKQCMSSPRKQWALIANAQAILALSCHQLHRDAEALPHLVQDREFVEREMRRAATFTPRWLLYDFVNTRILLREASSLIESNQNAYSVTNAETQYRVGALYENGEGSVIDAAEAITWYRKAADQGYQPAQLELGRIYQRGEEEAKAPGETAKWFHKVTERANAEEMRRLAWLMAASDDPRLRDGTTAVSFAEKAVAATGRKSPTCLDTLAAAYAEAGQFAEAVSAEKEAIARPTTDDQKKVYAARLKLYELKFAYRGDE